LVDVITIKEILMKRYEIAVIPGDGIGPEVMNATLHVLRVMDEMIDSFTFKFIELIAGDTVKEETGLALPEETITGVKASDACLFAAVGETAKEVILPLRQKLELYANIRPAKVFPKVSNIRGNLDLIIVRENTEGLYKGIQDGGDTWGITLRVITEEASKRIAKYAFDLALEKERAKVTCVHKANVMDTTCGLFKRACIGVAKNYPKVEYEEMIVDACAMKLIMYPEEFDIIVTTNMFGDILSDLAAGIVGGLGMTPSGNIGENQAIFEPVHGTAPDIAGKGIANPIACILSAQMMLEWLGEKEAAKLLEDAVIEVLEEGEDLTPDLDGEASTMDVASAIGDKLKGKGF
jgi:3-isopropylmalate dehydrogenase